MLNLMKARYSYYRSRSFAFFGHHSFHVILLIAFKSIPPSHTWHILQLPFQVLSTGFPCSFNLPLWRQNLAECHKEINRLHHISKSGIWDIVCLSSWELCACLQGWKQIEFELEVPRGGVSIPAESCRATHAPHAPHDEREGSGSPAQPVLWGSQNVVTPF